MTQHLIKWSHLWSTPKRPGRLLVSRATGYRILNSDPSFPRPFLIGGVKAIRADELAAWEAARPLHQPSTAQPAEAAQKSVEARRARRAAQDAQEAAGAGHE